MARVLVDFHHSSLLRSLVLLFEERLGYEVSRPIGMDWYKEGFWQINKQEDTAKQFLAFDSQPLDGTPQLNATTPFRQPHEPGQYRVFDPGKRTAHRASTLKFFKDNPFDIVVASIPQHIEPFKRLIKLYNPKAKLIVQVGNNWSGFDFGELPVMASTGGPINANRVFRYHQEFDLGLFRRSVATPSNRIFSFINILENHKQGWADFKRLESEMRDYRFKSYGGQCRDGNVTGPENLAKKMREAGAIFHVKDGGDGFGHIIHNAFAIGRPVIVRRSQYRGQLADQLFQEGNHFDLDKLGPSAGHQIHKVVVDPKAIEDMGNAAANRFREVVNYTQIARRFVRWLHEF